MLGFNQINIKYTDTKATLVPCAYGQYDSRLDRLRFCCHNPCHNQLRYCFWLVLNIPISAA